MESNNRKSPLFMYLRVLQKFIIVLLLVIMSIILVVATVDLGIYILKNLIQQNIDKFSLDNLGELFGIFLVILIGVELLQAVKAFLQEEIVHVEIVVLVAIIAIARKVIVWEFKDLSAFETFGLSAMMLALAITYFLIKHTDSKCKMYSKIDGEKEVEKEKEKEKQ
jgi:uncharacterized membrane protein (DUF373 family)